MSDKPNSTEFLDENFLKAFMDAPAPSGYEQPAQRLYRDYVRQYADEVQSDVLGNAMGIINPAGSPKIMLAGHVDEVGLQVRHIDEHGFVYFSQLGGVDGHITPGKRVKILCENGEILGIIGKKAIHLQENDERAKLVKLKDQYIDVGASSLEDAQSYGIQIGDPVIFDFYYDRLGTGLLRTGRCFDDRIGAFICADILRRLKGKSFTAAVYGVSTTQEEVGCRGATPSAFHIAPDIGIAFDVDHSSDTPDIGDKELGAVTLGGGPVIARGPNINPKLFALIVDTAKELEISVQIRAEPRGTGTDANPMQLSRSGMAIGLISIPNRFMHTMSEIVHLGDVEAIVKLMVAVIQKLTPDLAFTPQ